MRELSVYYCKKCGRYAYFQLPKNAVCHGCDIAMTIIKIPYQEFMDLSYEERDILISREIIKSSPSFVQRITAPGKQFNQRQVIGTLTNQLEELQTENQQLNETIEWMHAAIWDAIKQNKELSNMLHQLKDMDNKE